MYDSKYLYYKNKPHEINLMILGIKILVFYYRLNP